MAFNDIIKKIIYGNDSDEEYEENDSSAYGDEYAYAEEGQDSVSQGKTAAKGETAGYAGQVSNNVNMTSGTAIEMKVVKPDTLDSASQIADCLLDRKTILLNLEDTSKETSRRLIDFLNGVAYAINGDLKKVATNTYVVTPNNVEISGEQIKETQDKNDIA